MRDFIHLHVHTYYSLLDGQSPINQLVEKAVKDGMKGMAITDHGNMFGIKEFFDCCQKLNKSRKKEGKEPFKPIFGCEMYVARRGDKLLKEQRKDMGGWHLVVLAKNMVGYHNLIRLVSRSWVDGFYMHPRTDFADLERYHEGLIISSACLGGEIPQHIMHGDLEAASKRVEWFKNIWGEDFYIELQRHQVKDPAILANRETYEEQKKVEPHLIALAKRYGVKLICTNDSHFVNEENAEAHDHLLCLSTGKDLDDPNRMRYSKQEWFKTRDEMESVFADIPEALTNTMEILDKVEIYDIESSPIMPFFPIPEDFGTEEEWHQKFSEDDLFREFTSDENGENPLPEEEGRKKIEKLGGFEKIYRIKFEADYLAKLAYEGAERIYGTPLTNEVSDRIRFELHIMKTMGFPGYFLIVQDFINSARQELGVWVGPGRGSAAGSVVAYCLGITKIDPLKYDLLFERFLNPDRISLPDIDTDFDDEGRGKVLQWVMQKYGVENCAHIITYGTMAAKNSLKDVARVERLPLDVSNALCKAIPDRLPDGMKSNLTNIIKCTPELQLAEASSDPRMRNTIKYARMLEGTVRNIGIHACGFIICRDPISEHVPVSTADDPDFPEIKTAVTQYDGHVIESTGLIKMDFLGLKTLSEQKEAVRNVKISRGIEVDLDHIPIDDELTYRLYQEGQTVGTFQFESPGMRKYLRELHPTVFEDLIAMNALYRPGPMDKIPSFIARKNGREKITYDIPCMEKYLKDTYGITVYQEQVMLLSRQLADFTRGESDALRKAMGKKKADIVAKMKPKFIEGGIRNGHDPQVLERIWGDWEKFASYAFNKSHAACYSWVAYQTAYLKAHFPAEYMAALLSCRSDNITEVQKLMEESRSMGIKTLGPDVNDSLSKFSVNADGNIRFGLSGIKGVGENAIRSIIEEREKNGKFKDVYDFFERVNLNTCNRKNLECLIKAGAFDGFEGICREQYFVPNERNVTFLEILVSFGQRYQIDRQEAEASIFGDFDAVEIKKPDPPTSYNTWSDMERLSKERELISVYISGHPLDDYRLVLDHICNIKMDQIEQLEERMNQVVFFGGIVTGVEERITKREIPFGRVTIEDFSGKGQITMFGESWAKFKGYFLEGASLFITANVQSRKWGNPQPELTVTQVDFLANVKASKIKSINIIININDIEETDINELLSVIESNSNTKTSDKISHSASPQQKRNGFVADGIEENCDLEFTLCDPVNNTQLHLSTPVIKINPTRQILDFITAKGMEYKIN